MNLTEEEIVRRRELKRIRNARYRAKQRGEVFDEDTFVEPQPQARQAVVRRRAEGEGAEPYDAEPKGTTAEMLTILGAGAVVIGGLFAAVKLTHR